jgi:hypothetical protein
VDKLVVDKLKWYNVNVYCNFMTIFSLYDLLINYYLRCVKYTGL